jgi:hypothetical protein
MTFSGNGKSTKGNQEMAVAEELVILVKADADNALKNLQKVEKQTGLTLKGFLNLIPGPIKAAVSFAALARVGKDMIRSFGEQEEAIAAMGAALRASGDYSAIAVEDFVALSFELQKVTTYGDEVTLSAMAMLRQLTTLDNDGIKNIIPAVQDFASAMGVDLVQAASLVGKTLGSDTNALSRYGVQIDMTGSESERLAELTDQLKSKFGGMATSLASTDTGALKQFKNAMGDLAELGGEMIVDFLMPATNGATKFAIAIAEAAEKSKQLQSALAGETMLADRQKNIDILREEIKLLETQADVLAEQGIDSSLVNEETLKQLRSRLRQEQQLYSQEKMQADLREAAAVRLAVLQKTAAKDTKDAISLFVKEQDAVEGLGDTLKTDLSQGIELAADGMQAYADSLTMTIPTMEELAASEQMWMDIDKERSDAAIASREEEAATLDELKAKYEDYYKAIGEGVADAATALTEYAQGEKTAAEAGEALAEVAKEAAVAILKAIGEEAFAQAALNTAKALLGNPAAAAAAVGFGVAGVAAYAGAGIVSGLAEGGVVPASPGGSLYTIGEGGSDEAVIPLDKYNIGGNTTVNNIFGTIWQEKQITREIAKRSAYANRRY